MLFKKTKNLIIFLKNDCFQLPFEVYYVFVTQKLKILENVKHFFLAWTLVTSATSRGPNFDLSNLNRVSNFSWRCQFSYEILFVDKNENLEALDCVLQSGQTLWKIKLLKVSLPSLMTLRGNTSLRRLIIYNNTKWK